MKLSRESVIGASIVFLTACTGGAEKPVKLDSEIGQSERSEEISVPCQVVIPIAGAPFMMPGACRD